MSTLFSDDFNRANSTNLGASWNEDSLDSSIATNQLSLPTVGGSSPAVVSTTSTAMTAVADMAVSAKSVTGTGHDGGPIARRTSSGVMYALDVYLSGAQWKAEIYRHTTLSASTLVATANVSAHTANDVYKLEAQGTALRGFRNGTQVVSGTDGNITAAGQGGVYSWKSGGALYDDFQIDDFGGGASQAAVHKSLLMTGVGS